MTTTEEIKTRVTNRLRLDDRVIPDNIKVEVADSTVRLSGTVPTYTGLRAAEDDALFIPGVTAVYNELEVSTPTEVTVPTDEEIAERIRSIYSWNENLRSFDLSVDVNKGWVILEGSVDSYWKKVLAEDLANTVWGVIDVKNELTIVPTGDVKDEQIAQNIKDALKLHRDVDVEGIDVKVAHGEVTLSGVAETHAEALAAYDAAFYTAGVTNVNDETTVLIDKL